MSFEFFRFSTLSTNHTLSYMANPLHFALVSNPRIAHNQKCSVWSGAEERTAPGMLKCLAAQPRNFPETNREIAHIRAHSAMTIGAIATNAIPADSYGPMLQAGLILCLMGCLPEFLSVPDYAPTSVDAPR